VSREPGEHGGGCHSTTMPVASRRSVLISNTRRKSPLTLTGTPTSLCSSGKADCSAAMACWPEAPIWANMCARVAGSHSPRSSIPTAAWMTLPATTLGDRIPPAPGAPGAGSQWALVRADRPAASDTPGCRDRPRRTRRGIPPAPGPPRALLRSRFSAVRMRQGRRLPAVAARSPHTESRRRVHQKPAHGVCDAGRAAIGRVLSGHGQSSWCVCKEQAIFVPLPSPL